MNTIGLAEQLRRLEHDLVARALQACRGDAGRAAEYLHVTQKHVYVLVRRHGFNVREVFTYRRSRPGPVLPGDLRRRLLCLKCDEMFISKDPKKERVCPTCRQENARAHLLEAM